MLPVRSARSSRRRVKRSAAKITTAILRNSEGCPLSGPRRIHERAPLTLEPIPGANGAAMRSDGEQRDRDHEALPAPVGDLDHGDQCDQSESGPHRLFGEDTIRRVAEVGFGDRRRREHHDEAEHDQHRNHTSDGIERSRRRPEHLWSEAGALRPGPPSGLRLTSRRLGTSVQTVERCLSSIADADRAGHVDPSRFEPLMDAVGVVGAVVDPLFGSNRSSTKERKWSPRASKPEYWSKLAQPGESSTVAPGAASAIGSLDGLAEVGDDLDDGHGGERRDNALRRVAQRDHRIDAAHVRSHGRQIDALVVPARNQDQSIERAHRCGGGVGRGRLRIVVPRHAVPGAEVFEPVRRAGEGSQGRRDRAERHRAPSRARAPKRPTHWSDRAEDSASSPRCRR